ncbi:MAG: tetratricopeptide repeat protein [Anaerolineae bacterium]
MNERATTWGDLLARRNGRYVVGRRYETEQFRLNYLYDVPQTLLFVLEGPPGIGKTTLLDQYRAIAKEHGVITAMLRQWDIVLSREFGVLQAMAALADQLAAQGMPLTSFKEIYREYTEALAMIARDPKAPGRAFDLLGGVLDADSWSVRAWDTYLTGAFPVRRSSLIKDPVGTLTERFIQDLNAWAMVRRVLFCIDDWHTIQRHTAGSFPTLPTLSETPAPSGLERWLLDLLRTGELSTNVWFAIATESPMGSAWELLSSITARFELRALSPQASEVVLRDSGIKDHRGVARRQERAKGNPLQLMLLSSVDDGILDTPKASTAEAYVDSLDPVLRSAVLRSCAARRLDEGVLAVLHGNAAAAQMRKWLDYAPLVLATDAGWHFRPALEQELHELAAATNRSEWTAAHRTLHAYYRQRSELSGAEPAYMDPVWQRDELERLYHGLIVADEAEALNATMLGFLQGLRRFYPWAGAVLRTWLDVTGMSEARPRVTDLANKTHGLWIALIDGDWPTARELCIELLNNDVWSEEVQGALRALHHLIAARLALPLQPDSATAVEAAEEPVSEASGEREPVAEEAPPERAALPQQQPAQAGEASEAPTQQTTSEAPEDTQTAEAAKTDGRATAVAYCRAGNARLQEGAYQEAIQNYDKALALDPDYVAAYYNRGLAYAKVGALSGAIADYARVIQLDPDQIHAYRQRAHVHARRGALEEAAQDYTTALQKAPNDTALLYDRANVYVRMGDYDRAIADYTAVLTHKPEHAEAYLNRGLARAAQEDYVEALRDYNQAIALDPKRAAAYNYRGQAYTHLDRYTEALSDYDRAINLNPRHAVAYNNRGLLYVRIEAYPEAIEAYQRAMAIEPDWATPYYNAACAAALTDDAERACRWLARAIGLRESYRAMALRDTDFAAIRNDPRFRALVDRVEARSQTSH